ncbi:MAG: PLP-dependent aminotransferase family protein [Acidilobaceae archaeon]|nr:PLP-dependent aminotransferase family protein [Acidilobaceae archaeon]MCX8165642.1 PLP-dependent aminotransferase family protein [Acidilobaceae archaeon]MDW7974068.1 PLP-dependent aminotransferase family protein [Sulfolobales archaeon]
MNRYMKFLARRTSRLEASEIRELLKLTEGKSVISFAGGLPDPSVFMKEALSEAARDIIYNVGEKALQYSPTKGVTPFIETLKAFSAKHGIGVKEDDDLIVTTGAQEAIYLASKVLFDERDIVVVEEPTYLAALHSMKFFKARPVGIPIDGEGMQVNQLEEMLRKGTRIKAVYVNPTAQNPSGTTMSLERRKYLLELASIYDFLIIEDDPYGYFVFEGESPATLKSLDGEGRVIYVGTFSKILAPGLRIGWALGPKELINYFELAKQNLNLHTSTLTQYVAMEAVKRGLVEKSIEKARSLYRTKRDFMLEALETNMSDLAEWTKPIGGLFILVSLKEKINTKNMLPRAIAKGVAYVPGAPFFVSGGGSHTMRLNFSYPTVEQIKEGVRRLSATVREEMRQA